MDSDKKLSGDTPGPTRTM